MALVSGVVSMHGARVSGAHCGKAEYEDRGCRFQDLRHDEILFAGR
jgi:hypothetical protein